MYKIVEARSVGFKIKQFVIEAPASPASKNLGNSSFCGCMRTASASR